MKELNITEIKLYDNKDEAIVLKNDRLYHTYGNHSKYVSDFYMFKGDDTYFDRYEKIINEKLKGNGND